MHDIFLHVFGSSLEFCCGPTHPPEEGYVNIYHAVKPGNQLVVYRVVNLPSNN